jgi:catechol 2,3-dioxygenase-like lactoylglutathione lyase family enzyme
MKPKISLITLGVKNFDTSLAFYRDGLGFSLHNYNNGDGSQHLSYKERGSRFILKINLPKTLPYRQQVRDFLV